MGTHKCAVDWGPVSGSDIEVDGTTDIDTECGGIGGAFTGGKEDAVDEVERWGLY